MKEVKLLPVNDLVRVKTESVLLDALLADHLNVVMACKGRGLCATCMVHIDAGMEQLTPMTDVETRRLGRMTRTQSNSRLACQARVMGEGVVVSVPEGMYLESLQDLESLIGRRAESSILHPISGDILVDKGKLITRSKIEQLKSFDFDILEMRNSSLGLN